MARDLFESLAVSGQARFYEASDWQRARLAAELTSRLLLSGTLVGATIAAIDAMWASLLTTEAERRRLQIELERVEAGREEAERSAKVTRMAEYRRAAGGS